MGSMMRVQMFAVSCLGLGGLGVLELGFQVSRFRISEVVGVAGVRACLKGVTCSPEICSGNI